MDILVLLGDFAFMAFWLLLAVFGYRRLFYSMKFFQQQNYYPERLFRFAFKKGQLIDKQVSIPFLIAAIGTVISPDAWYLIFLPIAALLIQVFREKNPTKASIKPLAMTGRAKKIFYLAFALWIVALLGLRPFLSLISPIVPLAVSLGGVGLSRAIPYIVFAVLIVLCPAFLALSNFLLKPHYWLTDRGYWKAARDKLDKINPIVIAVTGSYAKTSIKNILNHILSTYSESYATKRSINTIKGIIGAVQSEMTPGTKYFVAEVGSGKAGQIPHMMKFLRPTYGIIASVGWKYLENFKTQDNIAKEKFSVSKAAAKNGGRSLLSEKNILPEYRAKYAAKDDVVFAENQVSDIKQTIDGISFTLDYEGKKHKISAPLLGRHQVQNIGLSFIMARWLGVSAENIIIALKSFKQTEHRLELRHEGGFVVLDDSFTSNVDGFLSALETGAEIKGKKRFILITPGIVGLATKHAEHHRTVGAKANELCDMVIAVKPERIEDFAAEIASDKLVRVPNLPAAREWLAANGRAGDVVLYENDLPDVYIENIRI